MAARGCQSLVFLLFLVLMGLGSPASAAIDGGDAFLQGNFAEAGVGSDGVFGSDSAPPSGFHPRGGGGLLGYVADDDKDGFSTDFDGDFFLPGTPEESFTVRVGGSNFTNVNGSAPEITGSLSNFVDNGFRQSVDWEGTINGLKIEKTYSVFSDSIALQVQMTLTNTTSSTMTDVFYLRNVDPDNNQSINGEFSTTNTVISQGNDGSGRAQVEATQNMKDNGSKLVLSGEGTNARATRGGFSNRDPVAVWNGDAPFSQSGTNTADNAISLAYKFDSIAPNESVTVNFSYQLADVAPPSLDLDGDDSSGATGSGFQVDFLGSAVSVADADVSITDSDSTEISFAEIVIDNDQSGDSLSVSGTLPSGISVDGSSTATELFLTGNASLADYETALEQIRFDNSSGSLGGDDRNVAVTVLDPESNPSGTANATIVARKPDLTVAKVDSTDPVVAGDQVSYTITVDNSGTGDASDVVVSDTLPAELSFVSTSGCNNDPNGFPDCQLGDIAASGNASYTLEVEANSGATAGSVTNQVSVSSNSQETDASNNSGSESTDLLDGSPSFDNGGSTSIATDEDIAVAINSILSASDPNSGQSLTWSVASPPSNGSLLGFDAGETSNGGSVTPSGLSYEPAADFSGSDGFTIRVSDGANTADISVSVAVNGVNDAPSFGASNPPVVDEDAGTQSVTGWAAFDPGPNESVQGVQTYTISNVSDPALFAAGPSVSNSGELSYTAAADASGTATFDVVVQDDGGTANGGDDISALQTFMVTVNPVNDQPSLTASNPPAVDEDAGAQSVTGWAAFDPGPKESGQSVQAYPVSSISDPGLFAAGPTVDTNGDLTYTPADDVNGTASFDVAVQDDGGTGNGGTDTSNTQNFTITINAVNDAPSAVDDSATSDEDQSVTIDTLVNDSDIDGALVPGSVSVVSGPSDGATAVDATSGGITYTPDADFDGSDSFDYEVCDDGTPTPAQCSEATVSVTVDSINDLPSASDDALAVVEGNAATADVLTNDDFGGDGAGSGAVAIDTPPQNGTASVDDGGTPDDPTDDRIEYTPNGGFAGRDSLVYVITDANGDAASATLAITVEAADQGAPAAGDDVLTVAAGRTATADVLVNDVFGSDGPGTSPIAIATNPTDGTAVVDDGGTPGDPTDDRIEYTPDGGFAGSDSLIYRIADADGDTATATVSVTVNDTASGEPAAGDDVADVDEDASVAIAVLANDDFGGDGAGSSAVEIIDGAEHGTASVDAGATPGDPSDDTVVYTPDAGFIGADDFDYRITDVDGDTAWATVRVNVKAVNDPPDAVADAAPTGVGQSITVDVLANDSDIDGSLVPNSVTVVSAPDNGGTTVGAASGAITYKPDMGFTGSDSFDYEVCDDGTPKPVECAEASVDIDVSVDSDGDGVPDSREDRDGTDPQDENDFADADDDGFPDFEEEQGGSDPTDPEDLPIEIARIDATGPVTVVPHSELEDLGVVAPADADDCCDRFPTVDGEPAFRPGRHVLSWAGDGQNVLEVNPLVTVGTSKGVVPGQTATLTVMLNGPAPATPFDVDFTVGGSATSADHDLSDGSVSFAAGETSANVDFSVDPGATAGRTIEVTLEDADDVNLGTRTRQTFEVVDGNLAPAVGLKIEQDGESRPVVSRGGGDVTATADVDDPNPGDAHTFDWSGSSNVLADSDGAASTFTFDPASLPVGVHRVEVRVRDDGSPAKARRAVTFVEVVSALDSLDPANDADGDGRDDASEGRTDTDGDGIVDHLDGVAATGVLPEQAIQPERFLIECAAAARCWRGAIAMQSLSGGAQVFTGELEDLDAVRADPDYDNVGGVLDFAGEVEQPGDILRVVIPQREPVPAEASYRKHHPARGWTDFVVAGADAVHSAPGEAGVCPAPGAAEWSPGLNAGDWCVRLTLRDGGPNDADGEADGIVTDPGGVASPRTVDFDTSGGGSIGGLGVIVLALLAGLRGVRSGRDGTNPALLAALLLAVMAAGTQAAIADDAASASGGEAAPWWKPDYVSLHAGRATTDVSSGDVEQAFAGRGIDADVRSLDEDRGGFGVDLGYRLHERWYFEAGLLDLGEVDFGFSTAATAVDLADVHPESGRGLTTALLYRYPLHRRIVLRGRLGAFAWHGDYDTTRGASFVDDDSETDIDVLWGGGIEVPIGEQWSLTGEVVRIEFSREPTEYFHLGVVRDL